MMMKRKRGGAVDCLWVSRHTDTYLDGELNKKDTAALEAHLFSCPECAAQMEEARELLALVAACDDVTPDATLHESVMRSVREQPRGEGNRSSLGTWRRRAGALACALLLLGVLLLPPVWLRGAGAPQAPGDGGMTQGGQSNSSPSAPSYGGSGGGSQWWEDIFGDSNDDVNNGEAPPSDQNDAPGVERPSGPNEGAENGDGNGNKPDNVEGHTLVLERVSGEPEAESLWERLGGEWEGDGVGLIVVCESNEAYLITEKNEYYAYAVLSGDRLILEMEDGEILVWEVRMEGDVLWLTLND